MLDLTIGNDRAGMFTCKYDKRVKLAAEGKMGKVLRFPHIDGFLANSVKYNCLTAALHSIFTCSTRRKTRIEEAAQRIFEMHAEGYSLDKLTAKSDAFVKVGPCTDVSRNKPFEIVMLLPQRHDPVI